jgi:hypothetical protein
MIGRQLAAILRDYAGFLPGMVAAVVISSIAAPAIGRWTRSQTALGWALCMSVGLVISATLTPSRDALLLGTTGSGTCDLASFGPGTWRELTRLGEISLNVLLLVPLGVCIGLLPATRARSILTAGAVLMPVSIELIQLVVVGLDRQCQASDVAGNLSGLIVGLGIGHLGPRVMASVGQRSSGGKDPGR